MNLRATFLFVAITLGFTDPTQAQVQDFRFTGTLISSYGPNTAQFGTSIEGVVTLDYGSAPDVLNTHENSTYVGQYANWRNGAFAIDGFTGGDLMLGTNINGGNTIAIVYDYVYHYFWGSYRAGVIANSFNSTDRYLSIEIQTYNTDNSEGDGVAEISDWIPLADEYNHVLIRELDYTTGLWSSAVYSLDSFAPLVMNIVIDGLDTGIEDFEYEGQLVSELIEAASDSSKNHGKFVSRVAKLTNELKQAGLITDEEKEVLMEVAAESSLGK